MYLTSLEMQDKWLWVRGRPPRVLSLLLITSTTPDALCYLTSVRMKDTERLLARRLRVQDRLPAFEELARGSVFTRRLRCGKPPCRCARGALHRATYLSVSLAGGRTVQVSLPPALVATARRWVANYQAWWRAIEAVSEINRELLRRRWVTPGGGSAGPPPRGRPRRRPRGSAS